MSKPSKKKKKRAPDTEPAALSTGEKAFVLGDYPRARELLRAERDNPDLPDGARKHAEELLAATGVEPASWWTFLGGLAFILLVILYAAAQQP